jgi:diaminohydroxyphosphoribosylaminopyrimidine deaminase/5-amino-6-(5-phosphoribosylamino)uracil reductase
LPDESYMKIALDLARKGEGWTSPNPMVGSVIVKNGRIAGRGYHQKAGTPHAEVHALHMAGEEAKGATVYVTLEPCCHIGRTPPCTEALIDAEVKKVVVAAIDPNPRVAGKGIKRLREAGIEVITGVMEDEAKQLNEVFIKHIVSQMPFISVKSALTLDGRTATKTGSSQWITGTEARKYAHRLRHKYSAVMVGIGTILADNSRLTTRIEKENLKNPTRVIIDSSLKIPGDAHVLNTEEAPTLIYTAGNVDRDKYSLVKEKGGEIIECPGREGKVDLLQVTKDLYHRGITSILVEGGAAINGSLLDRRLIDKVYLFIAPKLVGSNNSPGVFGGVGVQNINDAIALKNMIVEKIGEDVLFTGYPVYKE